MATSIHCSNCGGENLGQSKFCNQCGSLLMFKCGNCSAENPGDAKFCRECGVELQKIVPGIAYPALWKEQFYKMGWFENINEQGLQVLRQLMQQGELPSSDDNREPWIMVCPVNGQKWKITRIWFGREMVVHAEGTWWRLGGYLIATSQRFVFLSLRDNNARTIMYTDIYGAHYIRRPGGFPHFGLHTNSSGDITIEIRSAGPGLLDVVSLLAGSPTSKAVATVNYAAKSVEQSNFIDVLDIFFKAASLGKEDKELQTRSGLLTTNEKGHHVVPETKAVICSNCGHENSRHRLTCKKCRVKLRD